MEVIEVLAETMEPNDHPVSEAAVTALDRGICG